MFDIPKITESVVDEILKYVYFGKRNETFDNLALCFVCKKLADGRCDCGFDSVERSISIDMEYRMLCYQKRLESGMDKNDFFLKLKAMEKNILKNYDKSENIFRFGQIWLGC